MRQVLLKSGLGKTPSSQLTTRRPVTTRKHACRAEACLAAAKEEGIAREDIEEETGDLVSYMEDVIAKLVNHPERGALSANDEREQLIRTKAYYIWLDEGCPEGRADSHWQVATQLVATEVGSVDLAPPPSKQAGGCDDPKAPKIGNTE